jgi:molecular chaperone GrpE
MIASLKGHAIEKVVADEGIAFDPNIHEAVAQVQTNDFPQGTIMGVLQTGYSLHDQLLRPARVQVVVPVAAKQTVEPEPEASGWPADVATETGEDGSSEPRK